MIILTLEFKKDDGSSCQITRKYSDEVSDETLQEAVIEIKNSLLEN